MPQVSPSPLNCPKYYPSAFNPQAVTNIQIQTPIPLILLLILPLLPRYRTLPPNQHTYRQILPIRTHPHELPPRPFTQGLPLQEPHWLQPCPTHQNSPSSFFTSRASRHSAGIMSQRGQLGGPGCEGRAGGAELPPPPTPPCIPPVAPGPGPLHTAPRVSQPQQPHFGEAQEYLRAASSVGMAPGHPLPAHS